MFRAIAELSKALWAVLNSENNDAIVLGLLIACAAMLFCYWRISRQFRLHLDDKDRHIKDLAAERDKLQDAMLRQLGVSRRTSKENKK